VKNVQTNQDIAPIDSKVMTYHTFYAIILTQDKNLNVANAINGSQIFMVTNQDFVRIVEGFFVIPNVSVVAQDVVMSIVMSVRKCIVVMDVKFDFNFVLMLFT
jgi:hypothetical protein